MCSNELWLLQENNATVKLDLRVASHGKKTYSESRIEPRIPHILKKMLIVPTSSQFLFACLILCFMHWSSAKKFSIWIKSDFMYFKNLKIRFFCGLPFLRSDVMMFQFKINSSFVQGNCFFKTNFLFGLVSLDSWLRLLQNSFLFSTSHTCSFDQAYLYLIFRPFTKINYLNSQNLPPF